MNAAVVTVLLAVARRASPTGRFGREGLNAKHLATLRRHRLVAPTDEGDWTLTEEGSLIAEHHRLMRGLHSLGTPSLRRIRELVGELVRALDKGVFVPNHLSVVSPSVELCFELHLCPRCGVKVRRVQFCARCRAVTRQLDREEEARERLIEGGPPLRLVQGGEGR